jgi:alpha-mannosidase
VLSALKEAEDRSSVVVRLFNPGDEHARATLSVDVPIANAFTINFLEERQDKLDGAEGAVSVSLRPHQIQTLELARVR